MTIHQPFEKVSDFTKPDTKGRLALSAALAPDASGYCVYTNSLGQILLDPVQVVPTYEVQPQPRLLAARMSDEARFALLCMDNQKFNDGSEDFGQEHRENVHILMDHLVPFLDIYHQKVRQAVAEWKIGPATIKSLGKEVRGIPKDFVNALVGQRSLLSQMGVLSLLRKREAFALAKQKSDPNRGGLEDPAKHWREKMLERARSYSSAVKCYFDEQGGNLALRNVDTFAGNCANVLSAEICDDARREPLASDPLLQSIVLFATAQFVMGFSSSCDYGFENVDTAQ